MASHALAINASGGSPAYNAQQWRQSLTSLALPGSGGLQVVPGVRPGAGLTVSVASGTVTVTPGSAIVQGASSVTQGAYLAVVDSNFTATLTAADGTNPRVDLVYLRVRDTDADGSGQRDCSPVYVAGTPAASPTAPTIPAGTTGIILATISVPKSGAGSPTVSTATRQTTVASGGILPGAAPASPYVGQYYDDGTQLRRWNGTTWDTYGPVGAWSSSWTPTWNGLSVLGSSVSRGRLRKVGTTVDLVAALNWGTSSSLGTGVITITLPYAATNTPSLDLGWLGTGRHIPGNGTTWKDLRILIDPGGTVATVYGVRQTDLGWMTPGQVGLIWATGASMRVAITYESAS